MAMTPPGTSAAPVPSSGAAPGIGTGPPNLGAGGAPPPVQGPDPSAGGAGSGLPPRPLPDIPLFAETQTPQPEHPRLRFTTDAPKKLSEANWNTLSNDLYTQVLAS